MLTGGEGAGLCCVYQRQLQLYLGSYDGLQRTGTMRGRRRGLDELWWWGPGVCGYDVVWRAICLASRHGKGTRRQL